MIDEERWTAFTLLVVTHKTALLRYTLRRLNDHSSCQEVVDETFLIAWRRWDDRPDPDRELPWLYGIAYRVLSNSRRSRDRRDRLHVRLAMERVGAFDGFDSDELDIEALSHAFGHLKPNDQELLRLVYWEELTYREIALELEISENAVGIRINRAKRNLSLHPPPGWRVEGLTIREKGVPIR
ncbi:MAG TPA: sigma-70 family RNA polymerase sigma factor [Acidimicrobiales bacterium]|nr:sigma-70 family RNA polymerase sigma factor [Acidimicrobiales bacterium]